MGQTKPKAPGGESVAEIKSGRGSWGSELTRFTLVTAQLLPISLYFKITYGFFYVNKK